MKIISLQMQAFLAYKYEKIDFTDINDRGLFLITGPTGSGKTSIFDAITFALFGETSGSVRVNEHLRSGYADDKEDTFVKLVFEHHGKIYTITRSPSYTKKNRKTPTERKVCLEYDDKCIEKVNDVKEEIVKILGIDATQFKQIVMIAQGEFTKLIYSNTAEREKILRQIFNTHIFDSFQNELKIYSDKYKKQYEKLNHSLSILFSTLKFSNEFKNSHIDFLPDYIEDAKAENQNIYESFIEHDNLYKNLKDENDKTYNEYLENKDLNKKIDEYNLNLEKLNQYNAQENEYNRLLEDVKKIELIESHKDLTSSYNSLNIEIKNEKASLDSYKIAYNEKLKLHDQYQNDYANVPKLEEQNNVYLLKDKELIDKIESQNNFIKLSKKHNLLTASLNAKQNQYEKDLIKYDIKYNELLKDKDKVLRINEKELELNNLTKDKDYYTKRRGSLDKLAEQFNTYQQFNEKHLDLASKYEVSHKFYEEKKREYEEENNKFKRHQAGLLASSLIEGKPCPVCGSLHHPSPASLQVEILSLNELEQLEDNLKILTKKDEEIYAEVCSYYDSKKDTLTKMETLKNELNIDEDISKELINSLLYEVTNKDREYSNKETALKEELNNLKETKNKLVNREEILNEKKSDLDIRLEQLNADKTELAILNNQLNEYDQDILNTDYNKLLKENKLLLENNKRSIVDITNRYNENNKEIAEYETRIESSKSRIVEKEEELKKAAKKLKEFILEHFETKDNFNYYNGILSNKESMRTKYNIYMQDKTHIEKLIANTDEQVKIGTIIDLSEKENEINEKNKCLEALFNTKKDLENQYKDNEKVIKKIIKEHEENKGIFGKFILYNDLYKVASGNIGANISFERYVLAYYFEKILIFANLELSQLTNGRYRLERKTEKNKYGSRSGLDLSVLDYETGEKRDVQSLSGGESFKAALALALGLSTMIQNYAGGIELNTLFIDEGFGSLDGESLNSALEVLMNLQSNNKVIGIISHVDELKERIDTQIRIKKSKQGSTIEKIM